MSNTSNTRSRDARAFADGFNLAPNLVPGHGGAGAAGVDVLPTDPLFSQQWHLRNTAPGEFDLNLFRPGTDSGVWDDYTGAGVTIAVFDNGVEYTHPDLAANYDASLHVDPGSGPADGFVPGESDHGTAVAGIIGAALNGVGVVGVAHSATMVSLPGITGLYSPDDFVPFLDQFDVVNNSWSYTTPFFNNIENATRVADFFVHLEDAIDNGRGGLGTILVKSAGNGGSTDNVQSDSHRSFHGAVTVGAVNRDGTITDYSTSGSAILVSAFGSPLAGQVVTTDLTGAAGNDPGDFTSTFNGTSAATPMVSGIVALMLEANPNLGWRDVQDILAHSARHVGTAIGGGVSGFENLPWTVNNAIESNGGGFHFSNHYGFGLVDALAAVRLAETWTTQRTSTNESQSTISSSATFPLAIPDNDATGVTFTFTHDLASYFDRVEHVWLSLDFTHTYLRDLQITLTSPDGTVSTLFNRQHDDTDAPADGIRFTSNAFWGEETLGVWTVNVRDLEAADTGTITGATLSFQGEYAGSDQTFVFTDEYSDLVALDPGRANLSDPDSSGSDTINAAAVTSGSNIDVGLPLGAGTIDGVALVFSGIENAFGGDGGDILRGGAGGNILRGMRGDDVLEGRADGDTLDGGAGNDTVSYVDSDAGVAVSLLTGFTAGGHAAGDILSSIENLTGSGFGDTLAGDGSINVLVGGGGNDLLLGRGGGDTLDGGAGSDTLSYVDSNAGVAVSLLTGFTAGGHAVGDVISLFENLTGSSFGDTLAGDGSVNVLVGGGGNDLLLGRGGGDTLDGGAATDTASYADSNAGVSVSLLTGFVAGGHAIGDILSSIENLTGSSFGDTLAGDGSVNALIGNGGNDLLLGRGGGDTLDGGAGTDAASYADSNAGVSISLLTGFVAGGHAVGDVLSAIESLTGSGFGDTLAGNDSVNVLVGGGGNDLLLGRGGGDTLDGGAGTDTASYAGSNAGVAVSLLTGFSAGGHAVGDILSSIENLAGSGFEDTLAGDNADNVLQGFAGADFLFGQGGSDTASYADSNAGVAVSLLTLFAAGGHAAGDRFGAIENFTGSAFNDVMRGGNFANVLTGGGGDDSLGGFGGIDTFAFGNAFGLDTVVDWINGELFDFTSSTQVNSFADLVVGASGGNALISDGFGNQITVNGAAGLIDAADFVF